MVKEKKKYCPLSFFAPQDESPYCQGERCGWWDDITGHCAVAVIARFGAEGAFHVGRREQKADMEGK